MLATPETGGPNAPLCDPARVFNPDGTSDVLSTGIHFRIKAPGGGVIFRRIGLQIIHLDENGEVISIDIVGGNFDPLEEAPAAICGALA
jgi:hypothetical protein